MTFEKCMHSSCNKDWKSCSYRNNKNCWKSIINEILNRDCNKNDEKGGN